jgi:hypothetical protein
MTSIDIVNLVGWSVMLVAWVTKWYLTRKENRMSEQLDEKILVAKTPEEINQVERIFIELHDKRFGLTGSYGIFILFMVFGLGLFISNLIHLIAK